MHAKHCPRVARRIDLQRVALNKRGHVLGQRLLQPWIDVFPVISSGASMPALGSMPSSVGAKRVTGLGGRMAGAIERYCRRRPSAARLNARHRLLSRMAGYKARFLIVLLRRLTTG